MDNLDASFGVGDGDMNVEAADILFSATTRLVRIDLPISFYVADVSWIVRNTRRGSGSYGREAQFE